MEKQLITITIETQGDNCEMTDAEIRTWYETHVAGLFNPAFGTPRIRVDVQRDRSAQCKPNHADAT